MALLSRNDIEKYSYFFVTKNNKRSLSNLPASEFFIYKFQNPVSASRGKEFLTDEYVTKVYELSNNVYNQGSFLHPKYTNQKNLPMEFKYTELPVIDILVEESRNIR
jgi:hypothetical protein